MQGAGCRVQGAGCREQGGRGGGERLKENTRQWKDQEVNEGMGLRLKFKSRKQPEEDRQQRYGGPGHL